MLIVCLYPSPTLFELFSADDWMSASFHVCASAHGQNMETLWHFSSPLSPGCCETPIKDATSSVTDQPFRTGRGGGMKGERKKASKAWWRAAGKKRGKDEDMSGMQWCNKERAVGLWLTVKGSTVSSLWMFFLRCGDRCIWLHMQCKADRGESEMSTCRLCLDCSFLNLLQCCKA